MSPTTKQQTQQTQKTTKQHNNNNNNNNREMSNNNAQQKDSIHTRTKRSRMPMSKKRSQSKSTIANFLCLEVEIHSPNSNTSKVPPHLLTPLISKAKRNPDGSPVGEMSCEWIGRKTWGGKNHVWMVSNKHPIHLKH